MAVKNSATHVRFTDIVTTNGMRNTKRSVSMTIDRSIEEPCEATSLTHGFEAERRGRPLRLGSALYYRLEAFGLPVECGSGGLTKFNRMKRHLPKTHWLDAACVGASTPETLQVMGIVPLMIRGHRTRQPANVRDRWPRISDPSSQTSEGALWLSNGRYGPGGGASKSQDSRNPSGACLGTCVRLF